MTRRLWLVMVAVALFAAPVSGQWINDLNTYLSNGQGQENRDTLCLQWPERCATVDREAQRIWRAMCPERAEQDISATKLQVVHYRLDYEPLNQGRSLRHAVELGSACPVDPPPVDPAPPVGPPGDDPPRNGRVRLTGQVFADDEGPFIGVGFTCFWCLRGAMDFATNTQRNLDFMADRGFNYARILTVVGGEYWSRPPDRRIDPGRADYGDAFDRLFEMAGRAGSVPGRRGIKLNVVIFGDVTEYLTSTEEQIDWLTQMGGYLERHRDQIMFVEVANESTGIGLEANELKVLTDHWMARTDIPSGISAIYEYDDDLRGYTGYIGLEKFFDKFPDTSIDILTPHFDRDLREEGYRSARQSWEVQFYENVPTGAFVNNEPIGCGSSVANICDPDRLVADLLNTMMAKGAGYTYHTSAGVKGINNFWDVDQLDGVSLAFRSMLNLLPANIANGVNANYHWDNHPFDSDALELQIWTETNGTGVTRAFAMEHAGRWYVVLTGMRERYEFSPRWPMTVETFAALDGELLETVTLSAGERHTIRQRDARTRTYVLRVSSR